MMPHGIFAGNFNTLRRVSPNRTLEGNQRKSFFGKGDQSIPIQQIKIGL